MTMFVVALLLFPGIVLVFGLDVVFDPGFALSSFALAGLLGLGVGTLNCVLFGFFPTWSNIWKVLTRPLFILSGLFFTFESLPASIQAVLWYNPLIHVVGLMRAGFYGSYEAALRLAALRARDRARRCSSSAPTSCAGTRAT